MTSFIDWEKIDKFYLTLTITLILMSILFVFSVRGVFSMYIKAYDIDLNAVNPGTRVDKEKLNKAYNFVFNKSIVKLEKISNPPLETVKNE